MLSLREEYQLTLYVSAAAVAAWLASALFTAPRWDVQPAKLAITQSRAEPTIKFTRVPPQGGGTNRVETIAGVVSGVNVKECDCAIVLYSQTDRYYVQPLADAPFTELSADATFKTDIHLGSRYVALLTNKAYRPAAILTELPGVGGDVLAIASAAARAETEQPAASARVIQFSGRRWKVKASGERAVGPGPCRFSDSQDNVWVDAEGRLHLRLTRREGVWHCAEVILDEEHAYGTYSYTLDTPPRAIAQALHAVLGAFVWNDGDAAHHYDEIDFELSAWSQPGNQLGQYVVQPPSPRNLVRFDLPETLAPTTHTFIWRPDRIECRSFAGQRTLFRHTFNRGIPPDTKGTHARINLWLFGARPPANNKELEVVISRFEFKPLP